MPVTSRSRWLRHAVVRHRRPLAAGCTFAAVLLALSALQPAKPAVDNSAGGTLKAIPAATTRLPGDGLVAAPVRLADGEAAQLLSPGSIVDVLAADGRGGAAVVADAVEVLTVPDPGADEWGGSDFGGALILLAVTSSQATELAARAAVGPLSVVLRA